jgi:signal transduction histidine kinase
MILLFFLWQLVRAAQLARMESDRKTTFIDNLSHELKIPLAVVRMKTERLLAGKVTDPQKLQAAYQSIADENGEVIRQVDDLLDLVRTGKGTRRYARGVFDLNLVAHEAATALRDRFPPDGLGVKLADGDVRVNADPDAVRQIIRNLLDNAAKYAAAKGRVDIEVAHAGGWARVTVADRGDGIPPDQRERIFERFYRIDNDLTRTTGGTGIGLCLARCFARDLGGDVTVAARPGGGSIFTLELPEET